MSATALAPRIVVGVDGSDGSVEALRWAASLAEVYGAEILALAAWRLPTTYGVGPVPQWNPQQDATTCLDNALHTAYGESRPEGLTTKVQQGGAAAVLVEASQDAELVVVGSRGHGGFAGLLLGSVSAAVSEHARCPVLVTHGRSGPLPAARASAVRD